MTKVDRPRRRAFLIGVPTSGAGELDPRAGLARMRAALEGLEFSSIEIISEADAATRDGILARLGSWLAATEPDDACLLYFFGHGGRVRFEDLGEPVASHTFSYLACHRAADQNKREVFGILDLELSRLMTELDARCANVTVIVDCCHSSAIMRDAEAGGGGRRQRGTGRKRGGQRRRVESYSTIPAPTWAAKLLEPSDRLTLESHPRIVRLTSTSEKRQAWSEETEDGHIGIFTAALVAVLEQAKSAPERWTWELVAHQVRERVIQANSAAQWVGLAGPGRRLLFSKDQASHAELVGLVVPTDDEPSGEDQDAWLRVGELQGVELGDRWKIVDAALDAQGELRVIADAEVVDVHSSCSRLKVARVGEARLRPGLGACVHACTSQVPVWTEDPQLRERVAASPWLRPCEDEAAPLRIHAGAGELRLVEHGDDAEPRTRAVFALTERRELVELLEARAREIRLLAVWTAHEQRPERPLTIELTRHRGEDLERALEPGARLLPGDRLSLSIARTSGDPNSWFVSVLRVDGAGDLTVLNGRQPEGIELLAGEVEVLGRRVGRARQGFELRRPERLPPDAACEEHLLIVASRRPIVLAHLATQRLDDLDRAFALQGLSSEIEQAPPRRQKRRRSAVKRTASTFKPPIPASEWTWWRFDYALAPESGAA